MPYAKVIKLIPNAINTPHKFEVIDPSHVCCAHCGLTKMMSIHNDEINKSLHYNSHPSGIECIEVVRHMNFNLGNAVKYIWRAGLKGESGTVDLKKAIYYLQDEIKRMEKLNEH